MPLFGHKTPPPRQIVELVLHALEKGPATADAIEASVGEMLTATKSSSEYRLDECLRYLEKDRKIATAIADGTKLFMLTEAGLRDLLGEDPERKVASIVSKEFLESTDSWRDRDRLP